MSAERVYFEALNRLRSLISGDSKDVLMTHIGEIELPEAKEFQTNPAEDFEYAMQHRPLLLSAWLAIERNRLRAKKAKQDTLPKIDFIAGYRWNSNQLGKNELFGDFLQRNEQDFFLGIEFERPILNRGEKASKEIAQFNVDRNQLEYERTQQTVLIQLDNGARRLDTEWKRIQVTRRAREFARRSLKAEERKLQLGTSQVFFVLDLQEDLANAEVREKSAVAEYNKAIADYELLRGSLLDDWGIKL
ncbi:MAG: TolC family protein [Opitutaceae bacterium]|nr:TolC family protein [Opitutaceae bacterium]